MPLILRNTWILTLLWLYWATLSAATKTFDPNHPLWTEVLTRYRGPDGTVRYKQLKSDLGREKHHPFARYLGELSAVKKAEFEGWSRENQIAFLINAYNALTWKLVVDHYPLKGIKDVGNIFKSPWKREFFSLLDGSVKTLDPLQHELLRPQFKDFRIHSAMNLAAQSSPKLPPTAFVGERLSAQLDVAFRDFLNDPSLNRYNPKNGTLSISKIFDWYDRDFDRTGGVLKTIEKYGPVAAKDAIRAGGKIKYELYDWDLNESTATQRQVKDRANFTSQGGLQ